MLRKIAVLGAVTATLNCGEANEGSPPPIDPDVATLIAIKDQVTSSPWTDPGSEREVCELAGKAQEHALAVFEKLDLEVPRNPIALGLDPEQYENPVKPAGTPDESSVADCAKDNRGLDRCIFYVRTRIGDTSVIPPGVLIINYINIESRDLDGNIRHQQALVTEFNFPAEIEPIQAPYGPNYEAHMITDVDRPEREAEAEILALDANNPVSGSGYVYSRDCDKPAKAALEERKTRLTNLVERVTGQ